MSTAILGLGRMGRCHLSALVGVDEIDVVALSDASADALAAAAALRPAAARYGDVADALRHAGLESCIVATPTPTHPDIVETALTAGLHVLCEKPLALDPAAGDRLGALAE